MSLLDQVSESVDADSKPVVEQQSAQEESQFQDTQEQQASEPNPESISESDPESWYYDDDVKGQSDRPEWLQTKYKSVSEQAKAYNEAQKKLGAFKGAPEEYDLSLEEMPDIKLQSADPMIEDFLKDAKANNVSQEYVTKLLGTYVKAIRMNNPDPKKELEKLGPTGAQDLKTLGNWANNNLSTDESKIFKSMVTTADTVRVLQKLRGVMTQADTQPSPTNAPRASKDQILKKIHDPRYASDESFRKQVREELAQFG